MKVKRTNRKALLFALDTETQLIKDDTPTQNKIELLKKDIKVKEIACLKEEVTRKEYLEFKRNKEQEISELQTKTCNEIQTYALGYEQLRTIKKANKSYYKNVIKIHELEKHSGDYWNCSKCQELMSKKVKIITNFDNDKDIYLEFLDRIKATYPSIQKGKSSYARVYVHNLKFDARALEYTILNNQELFTDVETVVNKNMYYQISFYYKNCLFKFVDSLKVLAMPLAKVAKLVGMKKQTQDATYTWFNLRKDKETVKKELRYLAFDVLILQHGIEFIRQTIGTKFLTSASYAINDLQKELKKDDRKYNHDYYERIFKTGYTKDIDAYIRRAYFGGVTMVLPEKDNFFHGLGFSADCNSMYPASMLNNYPDPTSLVALDAKDCERWFNQFADDRTTNFALFQIEIKKLKLKKNGLPFFPKKVARFGQTQAIVSLDDIINTELQSSYICTVTNLDLHTILNEYDLEFRFLDGIANTKYLKAPFKNFVEKHAKDKVRAKREKNEELKFIAKLCLNSSYGKFAERFHETNEVLTMNDNGDPEYKEVENSEEWEQKGNILIAVFVTAFARKNLYEQCVNVQKSKYTSLNYVDTDSVHFSYAGKFSKEINELAHKYRTNEEINEAQQENLFKSICNELNIKYDIALFGYWKLEGFFDKAIYLASKRYIEYDLIEGDNVKVAGVQTIGRKYILDKGIEYFRYSRDHNIIVPFLATRKVLKGYKFINTYKFLTPQEIASMDYVL